MDINMNVLFVVTLGIVILVFIRIFGFIFKANITIPLLQSIWVFYPSFFYQVYYWVSHFGLISFNN